MLMFNSDEVVGAVVALSCGVLDALWGLNSDVRVFGRVFLVGVPDESIGDISRVERGFVEVFCCVDVGWGCDTICGCGHGGSCWRCEFASRCRAKIGTSFPSIDDESRFCCGLDIDSPPSTPAGASAVPLC